MNVIKFEEKRRFSERLNYILAKKWKLAVILFVVVIGVMSGILILDLYIGNQNIASAELAEDIQEAFSTWIDVEPEERNDDELNTLIEKAIAEFPKKYAAQRAYYTRGQMEYEKENWIKASEIFVKFALDWEESYLAPSSLFNAASAFEESGNIEEAQNTLIRLIEKYGDNAPQTPEAIFSLGRIAESKNDNEVALAKYKDLLSRFPESRWHDLAKSRILYIEK